jgi:hypothetical protein
VPGSPPVTAAELRVIHTVFVVSSVLSDVLPHYRTAVSNNSALNRVSRVYRADALERTSTLNCQLQDRTHSESARHLLVLATVSSGLIPENVSAAHSLPSVILD